MRRTRAQSLLLYGTVILTCLMLIFPVYWMAITALAPVNRLRAFPPTFFPTDPQWQTTSLRRDPRIFLVHEDRLQRPGPRVLDVLEEFARFLHPERGEAAE